MGRGKESSSRRDWSGWDWDDTRQQYYRTRLDKKGHIDVEYADSTPRRGPHDADAADYPGDMRAAGHVGGEYYQDGDDAGVSDLTAAMGAQSLSRSPEDDGDGRYTLAGASDHRRAYDTSEAGPSDPTRNYGPGSAWSGQDGPDFNTANYDDDAYYQEGIADDIRSHQTGSAARAGFAEVDGNYYADGDYHGDDDYYAENTEAYESLQGGSGHRYGEPALDYYPAPSTSRSQRDNMLDPEFQMHKSHEFKAGRIIKIWWSEGMGKTATSTNFQKDEMIHQSARRFLIVRPPADGTSYIVPISTYNSRGCTKRGSKPMNHGIIYDAKNEPIYLPGEPQLGYDPIRAHMYESGESLTPSSRVDYSRLQSIQHNIPVWFLGEVDVEDFETVVNDAVDDVWERRRGGSGGRSHRTKRSNRESSHKDSKDRKHKSDRRRR